MRAILISTVAGIVTAGAIYLIGPAEAAPRDSGTYLLNTHGGIITCRLARAPSEIAFCDGAAIKAREPYHFDCRHPDVAEEYEYCGKPFPKRSK